MGRAATGDAAGGYVPSPRGQAATGISDWFDQDLYVTSAELEMPVGQAAGWVNDSGTLSRVVAGLRKDGINYLNPSEGAAAGLPHRLPAMTDFLTGGGAYELGALDGSRALARFDGRPGE